jgi:hypothetical protein
VLRHWSPCVQSALEFGASAHTILSLPVPTASLGNRRTAAPYPVRWRWEAGSQSASRQRLPYVVRQEPLRLPSFLASPPSCSDCTAGRWPVRAARLDPDDGGCRWPAAHFLHAHAAVPFHFIHAIGVPFMRIYASPMRFVSIL